MVDRGRLLVVNITVGDSISATWCTIAFALHQWHVAFSGGSSFFTNWAGLCFFCFVSFLFFFLFFAFFFFFWNATAYFAQLRHVATRLRHCFNNRVIKIKVVQLERCTKSPSGKEGRSFVCRLYTPKANIEVKETKQHFFCCPPLWHQFMVESYAISNLLVLDLFHHFCSLHSFPETNRPFFRAMKARPCQKPNITALPGSLKCVVLMAKLFTDPQLDVEEIHLEHTIKNASSTLRWRRGKEVELDYTRAFFRSQMRGISLSLEKIERDGRPDYTLVTAAVKIRPSYLARLQDQEAMRVRGTFHLSARNRRGETSLASASHGGAMSPCLCRRWSPISAKESIDLK